jgi:hypothetical protein
MDCPRLSTISGCLTLNRRTAPFPVWQFTLSPPLRQNSRRSRALGQITGKKKAGLHGIRATYSQQQEAQMKRCVESADKRK